MEDHSQTPAGNRHLSPHRDLMLLEAMLHHQVGIDPGSVGPVLDLAAVGLVNHGWRNGPLEDWHVQGRLCDGDMLRMNAQATQRVRRIVRRWRSEMGLNRRSPIGDVEALAPGAIDRLAMRVWQWLVNPSRQVPTGSTLASLAGRDLAAYREHADEAMGGFAAMAEEDGARAALWRCAAQGGLACRHWWGTPHWPATVNRFLAALDDPQDPHWSTDARRLYLSTEPAQVADRPGLHRLLVREPWNLDTQAAQWVVRAGIGACCPIPPPPLPR